MWRPATPQGREGQLPALRQGPTAGALEAPTAAGQLPAPQQEPTARALEASTAAGQNNSLASPVGLTSATLKNIAIVKTTIETLLQKSRDEYLQEVNLLKEETQNIEEERETLAARRFFLLQKCN